MPADSWPGDSRAMPAGPMSSFSGCREAASSSLTKSPSRWASRWMCSWFASWACPATRSSRSGALRPAGFEVLNDELVKQLGLSTAVMEAVVARETQELKEREHLYRRDRQPLDLAGKTVIIVDDGLATGATMRAAVAAVKQSRPATIIVAVPVGAAATCHMMQQLVDEVACLYSPHGFNAVGLWYEEFEQTSDREVRALLDRSTTRAIA